MGKKSSTTKAKKPRSFTGVIRGHARQVQEIANVLRDIVIQELDGVEESYYGGQRPMAMYRTTADVCWIQPLKQRCNLYFMRGTELLDPDNRLEGSSERFRFVKVRTPEDAERLPIRTWLRESVALNNSATREEDRFDAVLERLRKVCLALPNTKETSTWGKPHFRVGEKIFCGCGEDHGEPRIGLKMDPRESEIMMRVPGITKAPYSRKGDGWVAISPSEFDDWEEIEHRIVGSYRLIAPKRLAASLDQPPDAS